MTVLFQEVAVGAEEMAVAMGRLHFIFIVNG